MQWWQQILLALLAGSVPGVILFYLNRKGANKKLQLEEGGLTVTQFQAQTLAYQDLLDRSNSALTEANNKLNTSNAKLEEAVAELATYRAEREKLMGEVERQGREIVHLQKADTDKVAELEKTNSKLERLRALFLSYVARTGIPLTLEEKAVFDDTIPTALVRRYTAQNGREGSE